MPHQNFFKDCRPESSETQRNFIDMFRGDTLEFRAFITEEGQVEDIEGGYFWFCVKCDMNDPDEDAVIVKTSDNGITITNGPLGQLLVLVDPIDTILLNIEEATTYYWDLQYQDSLGRVQTVGIGKLKVNQDVTRNIGFVIAEPVGLTGRAVFDIILPQMNYAAQSPLATDSTLSARAVVTRATTLLNGGPGIDELQEFRVQAAVGVFRLVFTGPAAAPIAPELTGNMPIGISNAGLLSNLNALPSIAPGDVVVAGGPIGVLPMTIEFDSGGAYGITDMNQITIDATNLA